MALLATFALLLGAAAPVPGDYAADLLGLASEIGTIEPGKSADLIAVTGDPIADVAVLKRVEFIMARGEVVKAAASR